MLGTNRVTGTAGNKVLVFKKDLTEMTSKELKRNKVLFEQRLAEVEEVHGILDVIITEDKPYGCLRVLVNSQKARNQVNQICDEVDMDNYSNGDDLVDATKLLFTFFKEDGEDEFLEKTETAIQRGALGLTSYKCEPLLPLKNNDKTYVATYAVSLNLASQLLERYPAKRLPIGAGKSVKFFMPDYTVPAPVPSDTRSPLKKRPKWSRKSLSRSLEEDITECSIADN